ncbi:hypothetical protein [Phytohabitans rumicis]|uniref:hypothetical protein n=1 Tax=Phytohabitans rumicis TaxID=1076125 RepID=UPI00156455AD|nr:hypothetical protein [Phytohabitans rumicis]
MTDAWELADPGRVDLRLLAAAPVEVVAPGLLHAGGLAIRYDPALLTPAVEAVPLDDDELARVWGPALYRVTLSGQALVASHTLTAGRLLSR